MAPPSPPTGSTGPGRRLAVLAGVVLAVLVFSGLAGPAAAAVPLRSHEFNLAGWKMNRGEVAPARTVVARVTQANPRPVVVSLSEVCSSTNLLLRGQWQQIERGLRPLGYATAFRPSVTTRIGSRCDRFGNGLAVLGHMDEVVGRTYGAQEQTSSITELRNLVCARATTTAGGRLAACSTHLVPRTETARAQAAEALSFVQERFAGLRRLVGGDFNLPPGDVGLDGWYGSYLEADGSRRTGAQPTLDSGLRGDYVFGDKASFVPPTTAVVTPVDVSDHHYYDGSFPTAS